MKKFSFLLSLLLISAFVLTACGPADDSDATPGVVGTPGVGDLTTMEPTEDVLPETTPTVLEPLPTEAVTEAPVEPTVAATEAVEGTESAAVPVTGDDDCNPYTVQGLLDMEVFDANGNQFGDVDGVIVFRDASAAPMGAVEGTEAVEATPAATEAAVETPAVAFDGVAPQVAYVVVDVENEDDEAVIPFSAFDLTVRDNETLDDDADDDVVATPAANDTVQDTPVAEDVANEVDACGLTVNNVSADTAGELPRLTDDIDISVDTWDEEFRTYWSGLGVNVPGTDDPNLGAAVLLNDEFNAVDAENVNGDDLGEVEDFIYTADGQFQYAVLAAGGFLGIGEKYVPVPMNMVQWFARETDDSIDDVGYILINITEEDWQNAPSFDSLDEIDNETEGWDEDIQSFWNTLTAPLQ